MQEFYDNLTIYGKLTLDLVSDGEKINTAVLSPGPNGNLLVNGYPIGYQSGTVVSVSDDYTIQPSDSVILASGAIHITLPSPIPNSVHSIKRISAAGPVVISSVSGLIDGNAQIQIDIKYASVTVCSNGTDWFII